MRNIEHIAKAPHIVVALDEELAKLKEKLNAFTIDFNKDPGHAIEWASETFERAAEHTIVNYIRYVVGKAAEANDGDLYRNIPLPKVEWTFEELQALVWEEFKYKRAVTGCTGVTDLFERYLLQAVLRFRDGKTGYWFGRAQLMDEEYKAWADARAEEARIKREAEYRAEVARRGASSKARLRVRKGLQNGVKEPGGEVAWADLLLGWPDLDGFTRRDHYLLIKWVREAHEREKIRTEQAEVLP